MAEALRWVQRNARALRGDPARVMVFGESAGAVNARTMVASPLGAGLFSRAAMPSGSCGGGAGVSIDAARAQGMRYATEAQCGSSPDVPSCLRGLTLETAIRTLPAIPSEAAYRMALVQALTDARFGCQARLAARAGTRGLGAMPGTYRYLYAHPLEGGTALVRALGAWHGVELLYVFQNTSRGGYTPTDGDLAVERSLLGYWTRFAATGDPNGAGATEWPAYATGEPLLRIAPASEVVRGWRNAECDGWDALSRVSVPAP